MRRAHDDRKTTAVGEDKRIIQMAMSSSLLEKNSIASSFCATVFLFCMDRLIGYDKTTHKEVKIHLYLYRWISELFKP